MLVFGVALAGPAAAQCREATGSAPQPTSANATFSAGHVFVALAVPSSGYGSTWAVALSIDTGPGGWWPSPTACPPPGTERPDWNLTLGPAGWCFAPQDLAYSGSRWPILVPCVTTVNAGSVALDFDLKAIIACCAPPDWLPQPTTVPIGPAQFYLLSVDQIFVGGVDTESSTTRRGVWRFTGRL